MKRKIYLEGELGHKFGQQFNFSGESVQDALRLIASNRPEFKKYLIDCIEEDIGFSIQVQGEDISTPSDLLLPLRNGDIVITPVVGGSKSGGQKILAAVLIAAVIIMNPGGFFISGGALTTPGLIASSIALNLAMTGIQQLMAPDPATDSDEPEGYLFNGSRNNVVEGDPIPLLYGELRVPGYPVSFEVMAGNYVPPRPTYAYAPVDSWDYTDERDLNGKELTGDQVQRSLEKKENWGVDTAGFSNVQTILFTDVISEGPIQGLVSGGSSIYLNDDAGEDPATSTIRLSDTAVNFEFTNGSTQVTLNKAVPITLPVNGAGRTLIVRDYQNAPGATEKWSQGSSLGIKITTTSDLFLDDYIYSFDNPTAAAAVRVVNSAGFTVFEGWIEKIDSATVAYVTPISTSTYNSLYLDGDHTIVIDVQFKVSGVDSVNNNSITLAEAWPAPDGTYKCDLTGNYSKTVDTSKTFKFAYEFKKGELVERPFKDRAGTGMGNEAVSNAVNLTLVGPGESGTQTVELQGTQAGGFNLSTAQAEEVDEIRAIIAYPNGLENQGPNGERVNANVQYDYSLSFSKDGTTFDAPLLSSRLSHSYSSTSAINYSLDIELQQYKPFKDFKLIITRLTDTNKAYAENTTVYKDVGYVSQSGSSISIVTGLIKERMSYPLTAMAKVIVNTERFQSTPKITYHAKGLKVSVPSNYVTRDESLTGVANYNRSPIDGAIAETYQDWDGAFRPTKVYTNNPAWIFYDIITNNRYGVGTWIDPADVDIYALYRVARYCDELVPDGNGGFEPRYTANLYITKATDAYKILKDIATIFRGMIYWIDGKILSVIDQASDPVYNFSAANVIQGKFDYESTGNKTRSNQAIVTWNNPEANYALENLIVEDRDHIINTGKLVVEEASAFGTTSEGQALRYGRWKLWTAKNQTEIVSFSTAINAAFLSPGDVINIQDSSRNPAQVQYSGRVSSTGTRNTTEVPLDRSIELKEGSTYELSILLESGAAFLTQASAIIGGVEYSRSELILGVTTEEDSLNLLDDSGEPVLASWKPHTHVESQPIETFSGSGISSLTVSPAFSSIPNAQTIWVIKETSSEGLSVQGSAKLYRILGISETSKNEYSITAVEHYNEKFESIDSDFVLSIDDPIFPIPKVTDIVPSVVSPFARKDSSSVELFWDVPLNEDGSAYAHVGAYEVYHNIHNQSSPVKVSSAINKLPRFDNVAPGEYYFSIRTLSTYGTSSIPVVVSFVVQETTTDTSVPAVFEMPLGATVSSPPFVTAAGIFKFRDSLFNFTPISARFRTFLEDNTSGSFPDLQTQDCSGIPSVDFSSLPTEFDKQLAARYVFFDASDLDDPFKLIRYYQDPNLGLAYFYDVGDGSSTAESNFVTQPGTVSVTPGSNVVAGTDTNFLAHYTVGDIIKFNSAQAGRVAYISSDTELQLEITIATAVVDSTHSVSQFSFDPSNDCVFASIQHNNGVFRYYPVNLTVETPESVKVVTFSSSPSILRFTGGNTLITAYTNLILTVDAEGYSEPKFKITGTGFDNTDISQTAETVFSPANSGTTSYVLTLDKVDTFDTTDLEFTVTVIEGLDEDNADKQRTKDLRIGFLKDGANSLLTLSDVVGDGTEGQVLSTDGAGSFSFQTIVPAGGTQYERSSFTTTQGQTSFTADYEVGFLEVYLNGVLLDPSEYTATDGTTVVLSSGTEVNDIVNIVSNGVTYVSGLSGPISLLDLTDVAADGTNGQVLTTNGAGSFNFSTIDGSNIQDDSLGLPTLTPSTFNDGTHVVSLVEGGVQIGNTGWDTALYVASADNSTCITGTFIATGTDATTRGIFAGAQNGTAATFIYSTSAAWGTDNDAWLDICGPNGLLYGGNNSGVTFSVLGDGTVTGSFIGDLTGNVTGDLTGNADTATKWATPRTITLTGDASGSVVLDGSSNVTLNTTVAGATVTSLTGDVFASNGTSKVLENGTDGTNATFTGDVIAGTIQIGGGYGDTGATFTNTGNGSFNGSLDVDGNFITNGLNALYGNTYIGGGYGDTGITLQSDGTGKFNGNVVVDGSVTCQLLQETSDLTLKENLAVIPNALSKVQNLSGYTYNFIGNEELRTGLIAQEVQEVLPMAVGIHEGKLTLAYGNLIGLLVEAIKELKAEVEELKNS